MIKIIIEFIKMMAWGRMPKICSAFQSEAKISSSCRPIFVLRDDFDEPFSDRYFRQIDHRLWHDVKKCSSAARGDWCLYQFRAVVDKQQSEQVYKFPKETQKCLGRDLGYPHSRRIGFTRCQWSTEEKHDSWGALGLETVSTFVLLWRWGP